MPPPPGHFSLLLFLAFPSLRVGWKTFHLWHREKNPNPTEIPTPNPKPGAFCSEISGIAHGQREMRFNSLHVPFPVLQHLIPARERCMRGAGTARPVHEGFHHCPGLGPRRCLGNGKGRCFPAWAPGASSQIPLELGHQEGGFVPAPELWG